MRHISLSLVVVCCLIFPSCHKSISSLDFDYATNQSDPVSVAIANGNWEQVLRLSSNSTDPLLALIKRRALYELRRFNEVLDARAIAEPEFSSYDVFLKTLSAYEVAKFDQVIALSVPEDLPRPLRERLLVLHGESHQERSELEKAAEIYKQFLSEYRRSTFRGDVLIRLADISLSLGDQEQASRYYEELYQFFPISDSDGIARQRLIDSGRFAQIDTDAHLTRIQQLRRSAHFKRAFQEITNLLKTASKEQRGRLELALAQVRFGEKKYQDCEKLAKKALQHPRSDGLEQEWRQLLASSYIRLSDYAKGEQQFKILLSQDIPGPTRELILYRLGLAALDHFEYEAAISYFDQARTRFPKGTYIESIHWFEALTLYAFDRTGSNGDPVHLVRAFELLDNLLSLPDALNFYPQVLYWKAKIAKLMNHDDDSKALKIELIQNYSLSFNAVLTRNEPFKFLKEGKLSDKDQRDFSESEKNHISFNNDLAWKRLELFRSVNFKTWGAMELDRFLESNQNGSEDLSLAVADRLESMNDYADLVRWADRNLPRPLKNLDLRDPVTRYHYPLAYENEVIKYASNFKISPFLIWGVMREESRFRADVISAAGAVGLMQLMPSLGSRIGLALREPAAKRKILTDPVRNIRYGAFHLMELKAEVDKLPVSADLKPILQVAAYNAGIEAVARWIKEKDLTSSDVFVESIPFQETRQYVKRVLQSAYIYYRLYGNSYKGEPPIKSDAMLLLKEMGKL